MTDQIQTIVTSPWAKFKVDSASGFLETAQDRELDAFDATKKLTFIQTLRANDFRLLITCQQMGISSHTIYKHRRMDKAFDEAIQESVREYAEHLEWTSRAQALEPKATLERIFQLRALLPERYARDLKGSGGEKIEIHLMGDVMINQKKAFDVVETDIVLEVESASTEKPTITVHTPPQPSGAPSDTHSISEERMTDGRPY